MFTYEQIHSLNDLEFEVYNYVIKNLDQILDMKIRQLAQEIHVSTTTILRFCKKMGCDGYSEFKVKLKMIHLLPEKDLSRNMEPVLDFMTKINTEEKRQKINEIVQLLGQAKRVIFLGCGSSGILAKYGARYLTNIGKLAQSIDDPYYPVTDESYKETVIITLSVSGETNEIIFRLNHYKQLDATIVSITNIENCTIAKMADYVFTYCVPKEEIDIFDVTTQVPVIYLIETIGKQLYKLLQDQSIEEKN